MAKLTLKSFQQILAAMATKLSAETPINDFSDGSVALTLLEVAATEDFQQYIQMLNVIRNYNLDTTEGTDLDKRASEYGLTRLAAAPHSGFVTIKDSTFTKIVTKIYAGLSGPTAGSLVINVDDASTFPASGTLYIGRGTTNSEGPISYSAAPVNNTAYWIITLDTALANDHGTDETVILGQGGVRTVDAGVEVEVPETDVSDSIKFELNQAIQILDGEDTFENVLVTALNAGGQKVPANSIVSFPNIPFTGATVSNPLPFVNGRDDETDQQLRDRIRDVIQALSRGTSRSVKSGIVGLIDEATNSSIVSANIVPPVTLADGPTKVYIDNGRGLEPSIAAVGLEILTAAATGGEKFFQSQQFPMVKASVISQNVQPFNLSGGETLIFSIGTDEETFTFVAADFGNAGKAMATEISEAINRRAVLFEARTITDTEGRRVMITPKARTNEEIQIDPNSTAQAVLNFTELQVFTAKLYKNDKLLTKDGVTASILSAAQPFNLSGDVFTTTDSDITVTPNSRLVTKSVAGSNGFTQLISTGDYIKFVSDTDVFYRRVRTVVSDTKLILDTAYPSSGGGIGNIVIWNSVQLEVAANGDIQETEVVSFGPNDFLNPSQALASEVLVRMFDEVNLSTTELAVNNTKIKVISDLQDSANSKMQVTGGGAAIAMGFSTSSTLTGTLTFTGNGVVVTGSGTVFLSELVEGQWIKANADDASTWSKVDTIESDTVLYLAHGYRGSNHSGVASSKINFSAMSVGKNKDYTLNRSNGQVELNSALIAGDNLTLGSVNTRAFSDSIPATFDFTSLGATSTLIVAVDGGFHGTVTTGDNTVPYDTFIDTSLINYHPNLFVGFYVEWLTGQNSGQTSFVGSYNSSTGQISCSSSFTNPIAIGDKFVLSQVVTFTHASDFLNPASASAQEVVTALNSRLLGSSAAALSNNRVRISTTNFGSDATLQIKGGTANNVLAFPTLLETSELTNIAFVKTTSSDRNGNPAAIGFTLGPSQNLVAIFDGDNVNKTFSVPLEVLGTVTTGGSGTFTSTGVGAKYTVASYFNDFWLYWISGSNAGSVQLVTSYSGLTGVFTQSDVFPSPIANPIVIGDTFSIVPRTSDNVVKLLDDFHTTTLSIVADPEDTGITGDFVQISTRLPGSTGKVFITGGTANELGIAITAVPGGGPVNDVNTNSKAGVEPGLYVNLTVDGSVTTGDNTVPYDTFLDTSMISSFPSYFNGMTIEFLSGTNKGFKTTIGSYNNVTGQIVLASPAQNTIVIGDTYRISKPVYVTSVSGTSAPYTITFNDSSNTAFDVSGFIPQRSAAIRDVNGLRFITEQVEGVDGYKYSTNLIQKAQWTIDGLDRDPTNYPGIGAAGTQFEVLTPVLVRVKLILDVIPNNGVSLTSISDAIKTAVLEYVNSLGVSQEVVLTAIIAAVRSVSGVFDVTIANHTSNIVIADAELARLDSADLLVG